MGLLQVPFDEVVLGRLEGGHVLVLGLVKADIRDLGPGLGVRLPGQQVEGVLQLLCKTG